MRKWWAAAGAAVVVLALGAAGVVWWLGSRGTELERAVTMAPAGSQRLSWTDWSAVRSGSARREPGDLVLLVGDEPAQPLEPGLVALGLGGAHRLARGVALGERRLGRGDAAAAGRVEGEDLAARPAAARAAPARRRRRGARRGSGGCRAFVKPRWGWSRAGYGRDRRRKEGSRPAHRRRCFGYQAVKTAARRRPRRSARPRPRAAARARRRSSGRRARGVEEGRVCPQCRRHRLGGVLEGGRSRDQRQQPDQQQPA